MPTSITENQFKSWFYPDIMRNRVDRMMLCGNQGDPFAAKDIIGILDYCASVLPARRQLVTHSNGGLRSEEVWREAGKILQGNEKWYMWFSIDGLEDTNHLYRKNAKWKSIMTAIDAGKTRKCKIRWKFIVFKHNQHQIYLAKELSKKLGFDDFKLEHSDRWLGRTDLMPDREFVDNIYKQQKKILVLSLIHI